MIWVSWSNGQNKWQMQFDVDKCSVVHVGRTNPCSEYKMGDRALKSSDKE